MTRIAFRLLDRTFFRYFDCLAALLAHRRTAARVVRIKPDLRSKTPWRLQRRTISPATPLEFIVHCAFAHS